MEGIYAVLYLGLAALVGLCGRRRRAGFVGFFVLSVLLTPLLGLLVVYMTEERPTTASPPRRW